MFTAFAVGGYLLVTGVIGFDISHLRGWFQGGKWVDGPVWWQVAGGLAVLALGLYWSRHLGDVGWTATTRPVRRIKRVGSGKSAGVQRSAHRRVAAESGSVRSE